MGAPQHLIDWCAEDYHGNWFWVVTIEGHTRIAYQGDGTRQGNTMSCAICNIMNAAITKVLIALDVYYEMQFQVPGREIAAAIMGFNYCDDLEAYLRGVRGLRTFLDTLSVISINGRLGVHPGKTVLSFEAIEGEVIEVDFAVTLWR